MTSPENTINVYHGALKLIASTQTAGMPVLAGVALAALKTEHFEGPMAEVLLDIWGAEDADTARGLAREALEACDVKP